MRLNGSPLGCSTSEVIPVAVRISTRIDPRPAGWIRTRSEASDPMTVIFRSAALISPARVSVTVAGALSSWPSESL